MNPLTKDRAREREAQMLADLQTTREAAIEVSATLVVGLEHLIAAAQMSAERQERIAATRELIVRYRKLCRIGFLSPNLDDFIRGLGRQVFAAENPESALRTLLGKDLKPGRPRKDEARKRRITREVQVLIDGGDSRGDAIAKVAKRERPLDPDFKHERQVDRIYAENRKVVRAEAALARINNDPEAAAEALRTWLRRGIHDWLYANLADSNLPEDQGR